MYDWNYFYSELGGIENTIEGVLFENNQDGRLYA